MPKYDVSIPLEFNMEIRADSPQAAERAAMKFIQQQNITWNDNRYVRGVHFADGDSTVEEME